jgi:hypothetical protein
MRRMIATAAMTAAAMATVATAMAFSGTATASEGIPARITVEKGQTAVVRPCPYPTSRPKDCGWAQTKLYRDAPVVVVGYCIGDWATTGNGRGNFWTYIKYDKGTMGFVHSTLVSAFPGVKYNC